MRALIGGITAVVGGTDGETFGNALIRGTVTGAFGGFALDVSIATVGTAAIAVAAVGGAISSGLNTFWADRNHDHKMEKNELIKEVTVSAVAGAVTNVAFMGMGKGPEIKEGKTIKEIAKAVKTNYEKATYSRTGRFMADRFVKNIGKGMIESAVQHGITAMKSLAMNYYVCAFEEMR